MGEIRVRLIIGLDPRLKPAQPRNNGATEDAQQHNQIIVPGTDDTQGRHKEEFQIQGLHLSPRKVGENRVGRLRTRPLRRAMGASSSVSRSTSGASNRAALACLAHWLACAGWA